MVLITVASTETYLVLQVEMNKYYQVALLQLKQFLIKILNSMFLTECNTNMGVLAADSIGMLKGNFAQSDAFRCSEYNDYKTQKST
jgi:hypothetical protein